MTVARTLAAWMFLAAMLYPGAARARVVRVVVDRCELVLGGRPFGSVGSYERLVGRVFIALDPRDAHNAQIVDLASAPRNARGEVEAWADFVVLRPANASVASGVALVEVVNRGGAGASIVTLNRDARRDRPDSAGYFGDELLMRMGVTVVFLGWQFDAPEEPGLLRLHTPVARNNGRPITGLVRSDWTVDEPVRTLPLGHKVGTSQAPGHPVDDPASSENVLTVRDTPLGERSVVPRSAWRFAREGDGGLVVADRTHIYMSSGFTPGKLYELVYRARDPVVVGMGLAMVRDVISYLKYDSTSIAPVRFGIAYGVSQTGRFLRHFLYQGFNTDEGGRRAFDGMFVHTAGAGRGSFNHRFAQPSRDAQPYSTFFYPTDLFPFTSAPQRDPLTGREDGLLARAGDAEHLPKVFYVDGGHEYYGRAASLTHTTPDGTRDVAFLPNERRYVIAGARHSSPSEFPLDESDPLPQSPAYRGDPLQLRFAARALFVALTAWVVRDSAPPPSAYPAIAAGTLVPLDSVRFPRIPGVRLPGATHVAYRLDFGPRWSQGIVDFEPPHVGEAFPVRVSQVDSVGNELGGIRSIELLAPVATYFPWQLRTGYPAATDRLVSFDGTFVPLPRTEAERGRAGDPRPSLERLYGRREAYIARATAAARSLVAQRFLLPEDVEAAVTRAGSEWDWIMAR